MALALGEDGDEHVGAGHLLAPGGLDVDHRALDDALEAGGRLGVVVGVGDEIFQLGVDVLDQIAAQHVEIDVAGAHHRAGILIVEQGQQEMLERGIFLPTLVGEMERVMERLLEAVGKGRHGENLTSSP